MTTPLIPTLTVLLKTTYTPVVYEQDKTEEAWWTNSEYPKRILFVRSLMTAYRSGTQTSFTHEFDSNEDALQAKIWLERSEAQNGYGYTITGPGQSGTASKRITVTITV